MRAIKLVRTAPPARRVMPPRRNQCNALCEHGRHIFICGRLVGHNGPHRRRLTLWELLRTG